MCNLKFGIWSNWRWQLVPLELTSNLLGELHTALRSCVLHTGPQTSLCNHILSLLYSQTPSVAMALIKKTLKWHLKFPAQSKEMLKSLSGKQMKSTYESVSRMRDSLKKHLKRFRVIQEELDFFRHQCSFPKKRGLFVPFPIHKMFPKQDNRKSIQRCSKISLLALFWTGTQKPQ